MFPTDKRVYHQVTAEVNAVIRNLMAVPLLVGETCIGVLEVINTLDRPKFTHEDLRLFQSFSYSVAIAIQKHKLMDDLEKANVRSKQGAARNSNAACHCCNTC